MQKIKLLLVITKADIGGAQVFVINLARAMRELGYDVEVAAGEGDFLFDELKKSNVPYIYLPSLKRSFNVFTSLFFIYDLYRLSKQKNYDIIHLNSSNTLIGAFSKFFLKPSPKIVFTLHGLSFLDKNYEMNGLLRFLSKLYFKIFLINVDEPIFVSNRNHDEVLASSIVKRGSMIYYGLDEKRMEFIDKEEARKHISKLSGIDLSNVFLLGSAGRLAYQKNYDFFINNFEKIKKEVPDSKLIIIGDGPYHERFQREIKKRNLQNDFILAGAIPNTYRYMKAFDVFTLPSHYEGLPLSLIEAVLAEIPILASDVGGNIENVCNCKEQVFELNNIDDYIEKLKHIKANKTKYSDYNKSIKEEFSIEKMVNSHIVLYKSLLK